MFENLVVRTALAGAILVGLTSPGATAPFTDAFDPLVAELTMRRGTNYAPPLDRTRRKELAAMRNGTERLSFKKGRFRVTNVTDRIP